MEKYTDLVEAVGNVTPASSPSPSPTVQGKYGDLLQATTGQKENSLKIEDVGLHLIQGAQNATIWPQLEKIGKHMLSTTVGGVEDPYPKTPEGYGQYFKDFMTLPINLRATSVTAPTGAVMEATGINKFISENFSKLPPEKQKFIAPILDAWGVLGMKNAFNKLPLTPKQELGQSIKQGEQMTQGQMGNELIKAGEATEQNIKQNIYTPVRNEIASLPAIKPIGKNTTAEINSFIQSQSKSKKIFPSDVSQLEKIAKEAMDIKDVDTLLNFRTAYRNKVKELFKDNPDTRDVINNKVYQIITENIEKNIKDPDLLNRFREANKAYAIFENNFKDIKNVYKQDAENIFKREILNKGTDSIEAAKKIMTPDMIKQAGYNHIAMESLKDGRFDVQKFKQVVNTIKSDRGIAIFGEEEWGSIIKVSNSFGDNALLNFITTTPVLNTIAGVVGVTSTISWAKKTLEKLSLFSKDNQTARALSRGAILAGIKAKENKVYEKTPNQLK